MIHNYVHFTYYEDSIICKRCEFQAFWEAHYNTNIVLTGTNSDCGDLVVTIVALSFCIKGKGKYQTGNNSRLSGNPAKCQNIFCKGTEHIHTIIDLIKKILQKLSVNLQKILANLQNILLNLQKYQRISA